MYFNAIKSEFNIIVTNLFKRFSSSGSIMGNWIARRIKSRSDLVNVKLSNETKIPN
jgi:hypothetical protein